jgi:hypothetical protein
MRTVEGVLPSSFRDPSGFVFAREGVLYRQVNSSCREDYDRLTTSGLYRELVKSDCLIPHEEVDPLKLGGPEAYKVIRPEYIPFVSYPYEWSFSQLKDAALKLLEAQQRALNYGMSLKDGCAYNMQMREGRPILIDTLSLEAYREGEPWVAYRQFCRQFVAPLALMSRVDARLSKLLRVNVDGVPLDLASKLLPVSSYLSFPLLAHVHLHARAERRLSYRKDGPHRTMSKTSLRGLVQNLESLVRRLKWRPGKTEWSRYYTETNYSDAAFEHKRRLVGEFLDQISPKAGVVWDLGANTGVFSRIASGRGMLTISFDMDPACVEVNYQECRRENQRRLLPLVSDLANPSPGLGWMHQERMSLIERGPADVALALALAHHLAISNNVPWSLMAEFFASVCRSLIIEFIPKSDSQVRRLLATRADVFEDYHQGAFETEFARRFTVRRRVAIGDSERLLYWMERRTGE